MYYEYEGRDPETFTVMEPLTSLTVREPDCKISVHYFRKDDGLWMANDGRIFKWNPRSRTHTFLGQWDRSTQELVKGKENVLAYSMKAQPINAEDIIINGWSLAKRWEGGEEGYIRYMAEKLCVTEDYVREVLRKHGLIK